MIKREAKEWSENQDLMKEVLSHFSYNPVTRQINEMREVIGTCLAALVTIADAKEDACDEIKIAYADSSRKIAQKALKSVWEEL